MKKQNLTITFNHPPYPDGYIVDPSVEAERTAKYEAAIKAKNELIAEVLKRNNTKAKT